MMLAVTERLAERLAVARWDHKDAFQLRPPPPLHLTAPSRAQSLPLSPAGCFWKGVSEFGRGCYTDSDSF